MGLADDAEEMLDSGLFRIELFDDRGKPKSQANLIIEIASLFEHFHDQDRTAYGVFPTQGAHQVWRVGSDGYGNILSGLYFKLTGKGYGRNPYADAVATIKARAINLGRRDKVYLRVANLGERIYLDLVDDRWRVIEVDAHGWRILEKSPVRFVRANGMSSLPIPKGPGSVDLLREIINVTDEQFPLVVGWLLVALKGEGPYLILVLQGEQGSGKSTTSSNLRMFLDPSLVALRSPPRDPSDLIVSAVNNHLVCLDNLSGITPEISDILCRFVTGGGLDKRKLYTDTDQTLIQITRPIIVNGIDAITSRPDLAERSIILHLPVLSASPGCYVPIYLRALFPSYLMWDRCVYPALIHGDTPP